MAVNLNLLATAFNYLPKYDITLYKYLERTLTDGLFTATFDTGTTYQALVYFKTQSKDMQDSFITSKTNILIYTKEEITITNRNQNSDYIEFNSLKYKPYETNNWCWNNDFYASSWRLIDND